jgi:hypothetical protein
MSRRCLLSAIFVVAMTCGLYGTDPVVGTWKLDASHFKSSNGLSYVDGTIQAVDNGDGSLSLYYERVKADGTTIALRYTYRADGKDYPVSGGQSGLTVSRKAIGRNVFQTIWKVHGNVITSSRNSYSKDLKTLTNRADNVDEDGRRFTTVTVWTRKNSK